MEDQREPKLVSLLSESADVFHSLMEGVNEQRVGSRFGFDSKGKRILSKTHPTVKELDLRPGDIVNAIIPNVEIGYGIKTEVLISAHVDFYDDAKIVLALENVVVSVLNELYRP